MLWRELVDYTAKYVLRDRSDLSQGQIDSLWPDTVLYTRFKEAQNKFVSHTYCILDKNTAEVCDITLVPATNEYTLSDKVLHVYKGVIGSRTIFPTSEHLFPIDSPATGEPRTFTVEYAPRVVRVYPIPEAEATLTLWVARLPVLDVSNVNGGNEPEVPELYHHTLIEYVVYRCLTDNDVDGKARKAATDAFRAWNTGVLDAKRDMYRLRFPHGAYVTPVYGFSWHG